MSNILMMYLPSFLINMNGLKCLFCAFIPYPKHLYSAGATDGSGYSLVFPFFLFTMTKEYLSFLEVVCPWHAMLYKTIDVPLVHLYCCDALCEVRTIQISIFMRIKFCGVWCNHRNCICVKHHVNLIFVKMKAICHIQFSCVTISIQESFSFMCEYIIKITKVSHPQKR